MTEIEGGMTYGALMAREYGIPAVAGINEATHKIKDGDYIRVGGTNGLIQFYRANPSTIIQMSYYFPIDSSSHALLLNLRSLFPPT